MALTDREIRQLKPQNRMYKRSDEKGLRLHVMPNGAKYWRHKYYFNGNEGNSAYGVYPEVSLREARDRRDETRKLLREGIDPKELKRSERTARAIATENTFENIANAWYNRQFANWAPATAKKRRALLDNDLIPWLGPRPIREVDTLELLQTLKRIENRGATETARNGLQVANQIFRYARLNQLCNHDPASDLRGALAKPKVANRPAIIEPKQFGKLLASIETYKGTFIVRSLLALCPIFFQRPGEMISMEWAEIDLEKAEWNIPAAKMLKNDMPHTVPIPRQALEILKDLHPLTGRNKFVFPSQKNPREKHASNGTINKALQNMGIDTAKTHCAHGFRASARTMLDEQLDFRIEWIEQQLAHKVRDPLGRAYNRTKHLPQRQEMMQRWADYLDHLKMNAISTDTSRSKSI
jgi:integrase